MPLLKDRNPSGLVTLVLSEFVPWLLLQRHTRIYFAFHNALLCLMQDFLRGYEEHAARNFRFKATPSHDARKDLGLQQTRRTLFSPLGGHNHPEDHAYSEKSYSSQAQHIAYVIMP